MTISDLLIIYLAFGAPLAVYKYLQTRAVPIHRRVAIAVFTFFFWVPTALEIGYLYLTNAYFNDAFVSKKHSDAIDQRLNEARESISVDLVRLAGGSNLHEIRETVDRYVGLADAARKASEQRTGPGALFEAAGRKRSDLGQICLMRRNLRRLERHHTQARRDFVNLLAELSGIFTPHGVIGKGIDLARQVDDQETVEQLGALKVRRDEVWNPRPQDSSQTITSVTPIAMTASLNND